MLMVLAQIYIFTIYPGPKFTQPTFTQNPNLHNTKFTPDPNLHDPRFTPPQIYKTQIYTKPDIHSLNFTQNPNLHSPKFTQSQIYNTKICIKFRPNISFKGKDNPILAELDPIFHKLVDTRLECGLRLPKALRACESLECRTRFERWDLTKGG